MERQSLVITMLPKWHSVVDPTRPSFVICSNLFHYASPLPYIWRCCRNGFSPNGYHRQKYSTVYL